MNQNEAFPGRFLKAADISGHLDLTVKSVSLETLNDESKVVVAFDEDDRGLVLNKTNFAAIVDFTGEPNTDDWTGTKLRLGAVKVDFQGKRVLGIRVIAGRIPGVVQPPSVDDIPF